MPVYDPRGGGNAHIDVVLSNISIQITNEEFVGGQLFPAVRVRKQSDKYYVYGNENTIPALDPGGDVRAPAAVATEIPGVAVSLDTYFCTEHAVSIAVSDEERENVDSPLSPDRDGTERVTSQVLLGRELAIHTLVTSTGNFGTGYSVTLSGTDQWSDYANSDPIDDWKTGRDKIHSGIFTLPNVGVIPYEVMSQLEDHPDFIERIKYSQIGILTEDLIGRMLRISKIIVPGAGYNTANPGQSESLAYIWGKDVLMANVPARSGMKMPAFGYEFVWPVGGREQVVERWRETARVADVIRVRRRYDLKLTTLDSSDKAIAGYLIKAAVA